MNAPTLLVPRYVSNLAALAESCGLSTRFYVDTYEQKPDEPIEHYLAADWTGTKAQLVALGVLCPGQAASVLHMPCKHMRLFVPSTARGTYDLALMSGTLSTEGNTVRAWLDFEEVPSSIGELAGGAIQVLHYADEIGYHGTADALLSAKVCRREMLPLGRRTGRARQHSYTERDTPNSRARRQLDGSYVIKIERPEAVQRRIAEYKQRRAEYEAEQRAAYSNQHSHHDEPAMIVKKIRPSYLRLVVDNDKEQEVTVN